MFYKKHKKEIQTLKHEIENLKSEKLQMNENFKKTTATNKADYDETIKSLIDDLAIEKHLYEDLCISSTKETGALNHVMNDAITKLHENNIEINYTEIYNQLSGVYDPLGTMLIDVAHDITGVTLSDKHNPNDPFDLWSIDADIYSASQIVSELISIKFELNQHQIVKGQHEKLYDEIIKETVKMCLSNINYSCKLEKSDIEQADTMCEEFINDEFENKLNFTYEMN